MDRDMGSLVDVLEAARLAREYVAGMSKAEFLSDTRTQDAVVRRFEIMGEAARRLSPATRQSLPQVPWSKIISTRNLMAHHYEAIDWDIVWQTIHNDLPQLIAAIEPVLPPEIA